MNGRRLFLARLGAGVGVAGASVIRTSAASQTAAPVPAASPRWQPTRHEQDDWYDKVPGQHRLFFDTITPEGLATGLQFASNFFEANKTGYGLQDSDVAVVLVTRHKSTAFGYNDTIWAKYGVQLSKNANDFVDPKSKEVPVVNVYATSGGRMDSLLKRGAHIAVCQMATKAISGTLARATGGNADAIFAELAANLVPNGHLVAAGILAVNRAQEHGYALAHAG